MVTALEPPRCLVNHAPPSLNVLSALVASTWRLIPRVPEATGERERLHRAVARLAEAALPLGPGMPELPFFLAPYNLRAHAVVVAAFELRLAAAWKDGTLSEAWLVESAPVTYAQAPWASLLEPARLGLPSEKPTALPLAAPMAPGLGVGVLEALPLLGTCALPVSLQEATRGAGRAAFLARLLHTLDVALCELAGVREAEPVRELLHLRMRLWSGKSPSTLPGLARRCIAALGLAPPEDWRRVEGAAPLHLPAALELGE